MTATATARRAQFLRESVLSASPERLVTMMYDRLVLDLERAGAAAEVRDRSATVQHASHAQDILAELMSTLDLSFWDGAKELFALYTHLLTETMGATVTLDAARLATCRTHVAGLRDAWHGALHEINVEARGIPAPERTVGPRGDLGIA